MDLKEGRVYIASMDFTTNKFPVPKGTRLVYDGEDHIILLDRFVDLFHVEGDPEKKLALGKREITQKLEKT